LLEAKIEAKNNDDAKNVVRFTTDQNLHIIDINTVSC
jgi:hypothetical protein